MKNLLRITAIFIAVISTHFTLIAKEFTTNPYQERVFIENKGQFDVRHPELNGKKILYAIEEPGKMIYFTPSGIIYHFSSLEKNPNRERGDKSKPRNIAAHEFVFVNWAGANSAVEVHAVDKRDAFHSYTMKAAPGTSDNSSITAFAYSKLVYKNLYPGIDAVYTIHPEDGYKYSLVVHPGADVTVAKMTYGQAYKPSLDADKKLKISTGFGDITEHAPVSFYEHNTALKIPSAFQVNNNEVGFQLATYDPTKTVIVDPWVQSPNFNTQWKCIWECETDAAGNAYIIGGVMPMQLLKYNTAGVLQWTHNTPYDTSNTWLGNFATDDAGNSFVTEGTGGGIQKIGTAGNLIFNANNGVVGGLSTEFWSISFNCDQTRLVIGGTGGAVPPQPFMYDVNPNSGSVTTSRRVAGGALIPTQEVRAVTSVGNGKYFFLAHDTIGYIHQTLTSCLPTPGTLPFRIGNTYNMGYKCENFRRDNTGIAAMKSYDGFVYTHRGNRLDKRNANTAAIVASVNIPGGQWNTGFGGNNVGCSGIDIDDCGNIYVGATNGVVKFNTNLTQLATYSTSFVVYDVAVGSNGDIIAAGSTGTSSSGARTGSVQSFAATACTKVAPICCDATICPVPNQCLTSPAVTLTPVTPGGTFSGPGVSGNTFNPAVAGVGTHTIVYTIACGSDSIQIVVNSCTALSVCSEPNGNLTVSGGSPTYTWSYWQSASNTPITNQAQCQACGFTWFFGQCLNGVVPVTSCNSPAQWVQFATGVTVTPPPGRDTIRVVDNAGTTFVINGLATVQPCVACPTITVTVSAQQNVTCPSTNNGSLTFSATGGTGPYTYTWSPNVSTTATGSNLTAGTYTVTVRDANNCSGTATATITQPNVPTVTISNQVNPSCTQPTGSASITLAGGTAPYQVTIDSGSGTPITQTIPIAGTAPIAGLPAGNYTITVVAANGCSATATLNLTAPAQPQITAVNTQAEVCLGQNNGSVTSATATGTTGALQWSYATAANPGSFTPIAAFPLNNLAPGSYIIRVVDASGCTATQNFTIAAGPNCCNIAVSFATVAPACGQSNGSITTTVTPAGTYTYSWSNSLPAQANQTGLAAGQYFVTVTDPSTPNCSIDTFVSISNLNGPVLTQSNQVNPTCAGSDGQLTVGISGGTLPYQVTVDTGGTPQSFTLPFAITQTLTGLPSGSITVTVVDGAGCVAVATATLPVPVCCTFSLAPVVTNSTCNLNNGSVNMGINNGSGNYTYAWSNGAGTASVSNLAAGATISVTVTDNGQNCSRDTTLTIGGGTTLAVSFTNPVNPSCGGFDGAVTVSLTGGVAPYQVTIDTGGTPQTFTLPFAISQTIPNLPAGTVNVSVTDAEGCVATATVTLTPPANCCNLTTAAAVTPGSCGAANAAIDISILTAGTPPYSYSLNGGAPQASATFNNLAAGNYTIITTDASGCADTVTATVQPSSNDLTLTLNSTNISCAGANDGSITVTPNGGTAPITYLWNNNQTTATISNLSAGPYSVTATDATGCSGSASATITQPAPFQFALGNDVTVCEGVPVAVDAGTGFTAYAWSSGEQTASITPQTSGTYTVTVTDANGCTASDDVSVTFVPAPKPELGDDKEVYEGETVGLFTSVTGATGGTYNWQPDTLLSCNNCPTPVAMAEDTITYIVTYTDPTGCVGSDTITLWVLPVGNIYFPNAFTPNGDGRNDIYLPLGRDVKFINWRIFNRWGEMVFESNSMTQGWDGSFKGKAQTPGVFVYYAEVTLFNNRTLKFKGSVTLIR